MTNSKNIYEELSKITKVYLDEDMSKHTSIKIGGTADYYINIENIDNLKEILKISKKYNIPINVIGNGSNILIKDNGIRGIVLKINLEDVKINELNEQIQVTVGAGKKVIQLAIELQKKSIQGLEFASGIPGTIGGAVKMNAGAYGKEFKDVILNTTYMDYDGNIKTISNKEHEFEYRKTIFMNKKAIILETTLNLTKGNAEEIKEKMNEYIEKRKKSQPIDKPNAGSTFKRGKDFITAELIDKCGLKGKNVGDAKVSDKHAGFIINDGKATANDVLKLVDIVKKEVYEKFDKEIELEVEILGE